MTVLFDRCLVVFEKMTGDIFFFKGCKSRREKQLLAVSYSVLLTFPAILIRELHCYVLLVTLLSDQ